MIKLVNSGSGRIQKVLDSGSHQNEQTELVVNATHLWRRVKTLVILWNSSNWRQNLICDRKFMLEYYLRHPETYESLL